MYFLSIIVRQIQNAQCLFELEDDLCNFRMKSENENQRHELDAMKEFIVKEMRAKYRGCNHPSKVAIFPINKDKAVHKNVSQGYKILSI